ncbi:linear amide C-N hydrolase [Polynucleobacter sp. AM-25C3]|jgi:penicillin V acylase-like amidase (Ntn superfamily)|uniref:linear amide C-N hydrolase n=1 Tax=Polynucleobacter sp. AM-25C3 TaxID=1855569 RepID=UPI001C0E6EEA|nr:linear amide C-N hydrolase [Polynucleobacter sp. AM-25C3]MBU3602835.1 linear amide C-N hydrolase [Polynucleobacter sp. AM-25C3]
MISDSFSKSTRFIAILCLTCFSYASMACTAVNTVAKDGTVVAGRNMDWAFDMKWTLMVMPQGTPLLLSAPAKMNLPAEQLSSKYAFIGVSPAILKGGNAFLEGQNSAGLGLSGNFMPGFTEYQSIDKQDKRYVSIVNLGGFVLGMFSTVKELKQELPKYKVWFDPSEVSGIPTAPWLHFVFTDRTGASIIVEFIKGQMVIYDNIANTLTNAPTYDWHLNNARNYLALSGTAPKPLTIKGKSINELGSEGAGMIGMPGDYTTPGRFIRAAYLQQMAGQVKTGAEANQLVGHILNNVDVPLGTSISLEGKATVSDSTQWAIIKDLTHNQLKVANYLNRTNFIQLDLNKLFAANKQMSWLIDGLPYSSGDLTSQLMK